MIWDLGVLSLETDRQRGSRSPSFSTWELSFVRKTSLAPCEDRELDEEYWETISLLCTRLCKCEISQQYTRLPVMQGVPRHWRYSSLSRSCGCLIWRRRLKEGGGKKIRMWQKYNKQVTDGGQKLQWPQRPFLEFLQPGPALTPSGFHHRKVQMGKIPQAVVNALEHKSQGTLEAT